MSMPSFKEVKGMWKSAKKIEKSLDEQDKEWGDLVDIILKLENRTKLIVIKLTEIVKNQDQILELLMPIPK